ANTWDRYLLNIYNDVKANYPDAKWQTTGLGFAQVFAGAFGTDRPPKTNPWADQTTFLATTKKEFQARLKALRKYYFYIYPVLQSNNLFERLKKAHTGRYWRVPKEKVADD